jgi:hypothetical protein
MVDAKQIEEPWKIEEIPGAARVFYRVHIRQLVDNELHPGIFREQNGSMSLDWERYSTSFESRNRAMEPALNGIVALIASTVRSIEPLQVIHEPTQANRAHSAVYGIGVGDNMRSKVQRTRIRAKLFEKFHTWEIDPFAD